MTKRKSFAGRVKAASKRTSSRPATPPKRRDVPPSPSPQSPVPSPQPATARLRTRELAADPEGTFVPDAGPPPAKPIRETKAARLAKRGAAATPTSNLQRPAAPSDLRPPTSSTPRPQAEPHPGHVAVGRILGPFGLKGELKVLPLTDNPARFAPKSKLYAALARESPAAPSRSARVAVGDQSPVPTPQSPVPSPQPVTVLRSREASGHLYLTLKGFPDRDAVDKFRHALLQVPESDLPPLPEGDYYRFQLLGLTVVDTTGAVLGTLDEIIETGSNDVYRVHPPEGAEAPAVAPADILLPALADTIITVDLHARRMTVDPPDWR